MKIFHGKKRSRKKELIGFILHLHFQKSAILKQVVFTDTFFKRPGFQRALWRQYIFDYHFTIQKLDSSFQFRVDDSLNFEWDAKARKQKPMQCDLFLSLFNKNVNMCCY